MLERLDRHLFGDKWVELPVTGVFEPVDGFGVSVRFIAVEVEL